MFGTNSICTILGLSIGSAGVWGVLRSPLAIPFGRGHFDAGLLWLRIEPLIATRLKS